jgi:MFS family permease
VLKQSVNFLLLALLVAGIGSAVWIPVFGHLSDRIGRRRTYLIGSVVTGLFGFVYFALLNTGVPGVIVLAIFLSLVPHGMLYGPQGAFIAEAFTPRLRYSGASLGYQLSSIIAGGPSPLIAAWLLAKYHSGYAIAWFLLICGVISFAAASVLPDHTGQNVSDEYDEGKLVDVVSSPATA